MNAVNVGLVTFIIQHNRIQGVFLLCKITNLLIYSIYTYIDIGVFILGFFMGKIIVKRSIDISFLLCLIYALISFGLMLLIGSLKYVFYDYMYSNFTFTFSIFIESLGDRDSLFVSIGTLISFFIGEIVEYINNKSNS